MQPLSSTRAVLGEGAIWYDGRLYWIDIVSKRIHIYEPAGPSERSIQLDSMIGTVVPRAKGGLVAALQTGFAFVDEATGKTTPIADPEADIPTNRFNDGKCDPAGRFWAGTMALDAAPEKGALYALETDGRVVKKLAPVTISNGICWSLDNSTMYYIDTPTRAVRAFDYDVKTGDISNPRDVVTIAPEDGFPDGMTIDAEGHLWIALWDGGAVVCHDPATGKRLEKIELPVSRVTACAFGGEELGDLYITTASHGLSDDELKKQPAAGGLFKVRPGVRGVSAFTYGG